MIRINIEEVDRLLSQGVFARGALILYRETSLETLEEFNTSVKRPLLIKQTRQAAGRTQFALTNLRHIFDINVKAEILAYHEFTIRKCIESYKEKTQNKVKLYYIPIGEIPILINKVWKE